MGELDDGTSYNYIITYCDMSGNCLNESSIFTTDESVEVSRSSSSGGGGGGVASRTYVINDYQLRNGETRKIREGDKISFSLVSGKHELELGNIEEDFVEIVIRSEPVNLTLNVGEEIFVNLTSGDYYDFYVKLNSIENNFVNLTVKRVFEEIEVEEEIDLIENDSEKIYYVMGSNEKDDYEPENDFDYLIVGAGLFFIGFYIVLKQIVSYKLHKKTLKHYRVGRTKKNKNGSKIKAAPKRSRQEKVFFSESDK